MDDARFTPGSQDDPHATNALLRAECPVRRVPLPRGGTAWLVTRYDDVRAALVDPRMSKGGRIAPTGDGGELPPHVHAAVNDHLLTNDPPDHTRLRRLVASAFTARRTELLRPRIQEIADELLDDLADTDAFDLLDAYAFPLPIRVICELLGVPMDDRETFRYWSNVIVGGTSASDQVPAAMNWMFTYVRGLIEAKRQHPADDLTSALIAASDDTDRLSPDELSSTVFLLLVAGHETTVNLIGNGAWLLLSDRTRWERLRDDPGRLPAAVEEMLRYESPVQTSTYRYTTAEVDLGGTVIPGGSIALLSLLSANRDERRFTDADAFDPDRAENPHVAFGHGVHHCLGAPLARLEAHIAFASLLRRMPDLHLADPAGTAAWRPGVLLHGLQSLPVRRPRRPRS